MPDLNTRQDLLQTVRGLREELDSDIAQVDEERIVQPGSFEAWSFKDLIAHLTGWRLMTAARLEAGLRNEEPEPPWPAHLDEDEDLHEINAWFYETNRDKSLDQVINESNAAFDRVDRAVSELPEDALLKLGQFVWLDATYGALGPAVVQGAWNHYHVEHEPDIRAWLARG